MSYVRPQLGWAKKWTLRRWQLPGSFTSNATATSSYSLEGSGANPLGFRVVLRRHPRALAYRRMGDAPSADRELRAARSAFEKLGAQGMLCELDTNV
jgi:hypothetical protein